MNGSEQHWAEDVERIDDYLMERLSQEDAEQLRKHLDHCASCAEHVRQEQVLITGIRQYGRSLMKKRLEKEFEKEGAESWYWRPAVTLAAAALLIFFSIAVVHWMKQWGHQRNRSYEMVMADHTPSSLWLMGTLVTKPEPFQGTMTDKAWTFRLRQGTQQRTLHIRKASPEELSQNPQSGGTVPSRLERTADGMQLTVYVKETDGSHRAGIQPTGASSFILYMEGVQISYQFPDGWMDGRL